MKSTTSLLVALLLCSCASSPKEIEPAKFASFFEAQRACANFVSSIFKAGNGSDLSTSTLEAMRTNLYTDASALSIVVSRARLKSEHREHDFLDQRDQAELGGKLYDAMKELQGFRTSSCDVNVKEHFMAHLYQRVSADGSVASRQLESFGLTDATAKERALMSYVLAGRLRETR